MPSLPRSAGSVNPLTSPTDNQVQGFAPIVGENPRVLVLGTAPSIASLASNQYYGHARNAFWPIMGELLGFKREETPYAEQCNKLTAAGIAVWDVLAHCERKGSLDSAIIPESVVANDFEQFFARNNSLKLVIHNGGPSRQLFERWVLPVQPIPDIERVQLPSTSPANASWSYERKFNAWKKAVLDTVVTK